MPNPLVHAGEGPLVRLDEVLHGRTAVLTAGQPGAELVDLCRRHHLLLIRISGAAQARNRGQATDPRTGAANSWLDVHLLPGGEAVRLHAFTSRPELAILVRPDGVIAALSTRSRPPRLPWTVPAAVPAAACRSADSR